MPKNTRGIVAAIAAGACIAFAGEANAGYTEVNISSEVNANIQTYSKGSFYPSGGTTLRTLGGFRSCFPTIRAEARG